MLRLASQVSWAASVALAGGRRDGHGEAILQRPRDLAFQTAEVIHIGDDAFADIAADRRDQRHAAGRHIDDLAGKSRRSASI
jgi:hypothetical protein